VGQLLDEVKVARSLPAPSLAREIRRAAGVSQQRLADELGVHAATVLRWEAGAQRPSGRVRAAYAQLLTELNRAFAE